MRIRGAPRFIVVLLAFALLFSATQCVAACTAGDCNSVVPPCHQHHGSHHGDAAKHGCSHVFQLTGMHRASIAVANTIAHLPPVIPAKVRFSVIAMLQVPAASPPGSSFVLPSVLRI